MIQRASAPPRGPKSGPSGNRGGIKKRRGGPVRVDKDGDLDMDGAGRGKSGKGRLESPVPSRPQVTGRGRGPASRGGALNTQKAQQAIMRGLGAKQANILEARIGTGGTTLQVDGLKSSKAASNPDGGLESLLGFLERKAAGLDSASNRAVKIKKSHMNGDSVIITASSEDIEQIAKLNNFVFAGATLSIKPCESVAPGTRGPKEDRKEVSQTAQETKEKFRTILAGRYDPNLKLLNLSALAQDAGLLQMGFGTFDGKTTSKLFPALMVVADQLFKSWQEKRDAIVSVSLANNDLSDVSAVTSLAQTFPDIKNLDLSSNNLKDLKAISAWRWKFRNLETLVLSSNPIETLVPDFKVEIMKWYPKLQNLNFVQVRTPEEIAAAIEAVNTPIPISGPDFRDVSQVGENFIRQFITLYDADRGALLSNFYDAESVHSLAVNMHAPRSREHIAPVPSWDAYTKHSRNLTKLTYAGPRLNRRYKGTQAIQAVWSELPATRHPDLGTEAAKYIIECHPLPGLADPSRQNPGGVDGLIITMHGEFAEQNASTENALRSFSRTFILGPGSPGGLPIRVVSDMLALRAWTPLAMPSQAAAQSTAQEAPPATSIEQQRKEDMARQLMEKTGMTMEYSVLCLEQTAWELPRAFEAFQQNKDNLPPDAFVAGRTV